MTSSISLVTMAILAIVLLSPGGAEGRQKSLDTIGNAALDVPSRLVRREAKKNGKKNKTIEGRKTKKNKNQRKKGKAKKRPGQGKRKATKGRKQQRNGKTKKKKNKGMKKTGTKKINKNVPKVKSMIETRAEAKFDHCDYLDLMEVGTRRADCGPGGKFLFKVGFHSHTSFSLQLSFSNQNGFLLLLVSFLVSGIFTVVLLLSTFLS